MPLFLLGCGCCMSENKNLYTCVYLNWDPVREWLSIMPESIGLLTLVFPTKVSFHPSGNLLTDGQTDDGQRVIRKTLLSFQLR